MLLKGPSQRLPWNLAKIESAFRIGIITYDAKFIKSFLERKVTKDNADFQQDNNTPGMHGFELLLKICIKMKNGCVFLT
jgi:hypothetical protein